MEKGSKRITVYEILLIVLIIVMLGAIVLVLKGVGSSGKASGQDRVESTPENQEDMAQTTPETTPAETTQEPTTVAPNGRIIALDAGHGGSDPGTNILSENVKESDINFEIMLLVKRKLVKRGYTVLAREDPDEFLELVDRPKEANENNADMFVSIHVNSEGTDENGNAQTDGTAFGIETHYTTKDNLSIVLAQDIQDQLIKQTEARDRGVVDDSPLIIFLNSNVPSVLVETGFITNRDERTKLQDKAYQNKVANGIAKGIIQYFKDRDKVK